MFRNKKGDMTLNIIIAAAIAMVVLVVMVLIFTGKINDIFGQKCPGTWVESSRCGQKADGSYNPNCIMVTAGWTDADQNPGKVCCSTSDACR